MYTWCFLRLSHLEIFSYQNLERELFYFASLVPPFPICRQLRGNSVILYIDIRFSGQHNGQSVLGKREGPILNTVASSNYRPSEITYVPLIENISIFIKEIVVPFHKFERKKNERLGVRECNK